jgi:rod shape-determining protein MreD
MRWLPYFILAYVALGVQIGLGEFVSWHGARPNLVLVAVLFIALNAPRDAALLGCFSMGLLQDLLSGHPPGLFALAYGLVALLVAGSQQGVSRDHPAVQGVLALVAGLITAIVLSVHAWVRPAGPAIADGVVSAPAIRGPIFFPLFVGAVYTALLAPLVLWGLRRFKRVFAFQQGHYRRGWR